MGSNMGVILSFGGNIKSLSWLNWSCQGIGTIRQKTKVCIARGAVDTYELLLQPRHAL